MIDSSNNSLLIVSRPFSRLQPTQTSNREAPSLAPHTFNYVNIHVISCSFAIFATVGCLSIAFLDIRILECCGQTFPSTRYSEHFVSFPARGVKTFLYSIQSGNVVASQYWVCTFQTWYRWTGAYFKTAHVVVFCRNNIERDNILQIHEWNFSNPKFYTWSDVFSKYFRTKRPDF